MLDIDNLPINNLPAADHYLVKTFPAVDLVRRSQPVAPTGWVCPKCQATNNPASLTCWARSTHEGVR